MLSTDRRERIHGIDRSYRLFVAVESSRFSDISTLVQKFTGDTDGKKMTAMPSFRDDARSEISLIVTLSTRKITVERVP